MICRARLAMLAFVAGLLSVAVARHAMAATASDPVAPATPTAAPAKPAAKNAPKTPTKPAPVCQRPAENQGTSAFSAFRDCVDTPEMVRIPAGKFLMGEAGSFGHAYERPVHEVDVPPFSIGRYEVTFIEWDSCHAEGGCQTFPADEGWGRGFRPVINVSWIDAQQYVVWLSRKTGRNYRLPSEAEWEYAARAGTETTFGWGDSASESCDFANTFDITGAAQHSNWFWSVYCVDTFAHTAPVGSFPPNRWGLHDMHGNVWEWVQDCWHSDYTGAPADGSAWVTGPDCGKRVNRGGGWGNNPRSLRSANRDADSATGSGDAFGFRVVRDEPPPPAVAPAPQTPPPASGASESGIPTP